MTEADVAANGAKEGDSVGDLVWTLGEIANTGSNNVTDLINEIGLADGNVNDHLILRTHHARIRYGSVGCNNARW